MRLFIALWHSCMTGTSFINIKSLKFGNAEVNTLLLSLKCRHSSIPNFNGGLSNAPVVLSRFDRYVVPTLLTPTFRRIWCWFRPGATLCHDVLRCCHDIATPEPRYCPVLTRLTSDTGKFSRVVLRYVSLPPSWSFAVATLSYAVSRIWRNIACHNVWETWHNGVCIPRTFLHVSTTPQSRCTTSCYAIITLVMRCCYVILRCGNVP